MLHAPLRTKAEVFHSYCSSSKEVLVLHGKISDADQFRKKKLPPIFRHI